MPDTDQPRDSAGQDSDGRRAPQPLRDAQTVTREGEPVRELIAGVEVRTAVTHVDDRGELCEIFDPSWGVHPAPLVYVYQAMVRPGKTKGWILHEQQDDRLFLSLGY